jgi:hypothetical protein
MVATKRGIVETVTGAAKAAGAAVGEAAAKLVGGEDARERAEDFAERADAHLAQVAAEDAKADYERAKLNAVGTFAEMPHPGPYQLRFASAAATFLDGSTEVASHDLKDDANGRVTYEQATDFEPDGPASRVTEAWLIAPSGEAMRCDIGAGLDVGAGRLARIPAGHLLF